MAKHYLLSPSGCSRWMKCPGSLELSRDQPDTASVYANEGTHAHLIASEALEQDKAAKDVERGCPAEMAEAVQQYLDTISDIKSENKVIHEYVEKTFVSDEIEDFGGTVDWIAEMESDVGKWLHLCDYKHGSGVPVLCEGNEQMLCYMLLAREHLGVHANYIATIVQPRTAGPAAETWTVTDAELTDFSIRMQARSTQRDEFCAGEHCRWCPALQVCDTLYNHTMELAKQDFTAIAPRDDVDRWVELMDVAPAIRALLQKIPRLMVEDMKRGVKFPGYKAVMSVGHRKWKLVDEDVAKKLAGKKVGLGITVTCPRKLLSPTQIEKMGYGPQIEDLVVREEKGPVAVPEKDRRPALDLGEDFDDMSYLL